MAHPLEDVDLTQRVRSDWTSSTTLLSPFDDLIIDRARTERLFGFRYRMEIYAPEAKRRYGYFSMPVLLEDRLVARIDPRLEREAARLVLNSVHAEPDAASSADATREVRRAVESLATFLGARSIVWPRRLPAGWRRALAG